MSRKCINKFDASILPLLIVAIVGIAVYGMLSPQVSTGVTSLSNTSGTYANGVLTFTDAAACGEWFNITTVGGTKVAFYFNRTGLNCPIAPTVANEVQVISSAGNLSTQAPKNISAAINTNATLSAVMTATNDTTTSVKITYNTVGVTGNQVSMTETSANASWSGSTMTGGSDGDSTWSTGTKNLFGNTATMTTLAYWMIPLVLLVIFARRIM